MGCWNESCAISGIDIPHKTKIYVALIGNERFGNDMAIFVPPVLGAYDDYGGVDLLEDSPLFGLKKGDNWRPREDKRGHPVYLDAEVFDFLTSLKIQWSIDGKTLGDAITKHEKVIRETVEKLKPLQRYEDKDYWKTMMDLDRLLQRRETFDDAKQVFEEILYVKKGETRDEEATDAKIEAFITCWKRAFIMNQAQHELRKKIVPEVKGPQHGGAPALIQFYTMVLMTSKRRHEEQRDDGWNWDEMDKDFPLDRWKAEVALDQTQLSFRDWQVAQEFKRDDEDDA
ncbi:hypothetical protein IB265_32900 [Ensifer sp. ENS10]|uniref:hypothetical protein n=1 Tax=Ensifer sp. ENS10 TaxID=2769286 RepID=UPI001783FDF1|nr:hypothetical protein [Ensifer sp. ENS10]MBD9511556.1 hypothetical protein [Ensifer sp. ENS10]